MLFLGCDSVVILNLVFWGVILVIMKLVFWRHDSGIILVFLGSDSGVILKVPFLGCDSGVISKSVFFWEVILELF